MKELDQILSSDPIVQPTADFAARVMKQVREEATAPPPLEFPWRRFLPGAIASAALVLISVVMIFANFDAAAMAASSDSTPMFDVAILSEPRALGGAALVGSLLLVWLTLRFAGPQRRESF